MLSVALVLNRPDRLAGAGYTIAEALERVRPEWIAAIPKAATVLRAESDTTDVGKANAEAG